MDQDFSDITEKDTIDKKSIFRKIINVIFSLIILFAIFSIIITIININRISNNEKGLLVHRTVTKEEVNYNLQTSYYLLYKIVKIDNKTGSNSYFRFWFMNDIDY